MILGHSLVVTVNWQSDKAEEISRFLTFRLDYNDFYAGLTDSRLETMSSRLSRASSSAALR